MTGSELTITAGASISARWGERVDFANTAPCGRRLVVSGLLNEGVAPFLRRADKIELHAAAVREVEESFAGAPFKVSPALVRDAAEVTGGYPFLIQLGGYFL